MPVPGGTARGGAPGEHRAPTVVRYTGGRWGRHLSGHRYLDAARVLGLATGDRPSAVPS
ncbi:hypothetical protein [uncultured Croceitalea sp.]|uniref:hypothetical protein n=1 Tax=uncultured Croceitalea sp. TaxID=1798908 RepID=UPI00374FA5EC